MGNLVLFGDSYFTKYPTTPEENHWWSSLANKLGVCVIKKTKQHEWQSRLDVLKECLTSCIDSPPTKEVDVMHLYYDVGQN